MEIPNFEFFINREKNKPCLVVGNAPTIINFPYREFKGIYILVSSAAQALRKIVSPDYWISANHSFPVPQRHLRIINSFKDYVFIFSDTAAYFTRNVYDYDFLKKNIKVPWFTFDDRHFNHKKCNPLRNCCKLADLYPDRITLQEFIESHFGVKDIYQGSTTAVIFCIMFAILMGCSPIYLQGVELPLYLKDYNYYKPFQNLSKTRQSLRVMRTCIKDKLLGTITYSPFYDSIGRTLGSFERLVNLCHKVGIEIYNLSSTSTLNQIKCLPYLDYRKIKKGRSLA
jgi:hypothetical protein